MKKIFYMLIFSLSFILTGCNYLDVVPKSDVETVESVFEQRTDAYRWLKSCYSFLTNPVASFVGAPGYLGSDELVGGQYARELKDGSLMKGLFIGDGVQMASNPYFDIWKKDGFYAGIRYCNIFLDNIFNCYNMEDDEKNLWTAEIKALKAHFYFELMRRYGPIILVPKNIEANAKIADMQSPRSPIDSCVNAIVALCDDAIQYLPHLNQKEQTQLTYYNKEACATLKAYTLLYAASPLFNGNEQMFQLKNKNGQRLFPDYDRNKWKKAAEAADDALAICKEGGRKLYSGISDQGSVMLNIMGDIQQSVLSAGYTANPEALLMLKPQDGDDLGYTYILPYFPSGQSEYYDPYSAGCLSPSMKMVEMFYTEHGLPINEDKQWVAAPYSMSREADSRYKNVIPLNTDILSLHRRREPRFYADIVADRTYWYRKATKSAQLANTALLVQCYQGELFGTQSKMIDNTLPQSLTGYWLKKTLVPTVPLSNYHNNLSGSGEFPLICFRMAELYLMSAEAWNEYLNVPDEHVYDMLDVVRKRAGIANIRDAWQSYAKNPQKIQTQAGMREIIRQEWNIEFAFEGRRFWNLRRWKTANEELNQPQYGWNILSNTPQGFYNNYEGPVVVWSKRKFTSPRDYFFPIRSEEVMTSGIVQNLDW